MPTYKELENLAERRYQESVKNSRGFSPADLKRLGRDPEKWKVLKDSIRKIPPWWLSPVGDVSVGYSKIFPNDKKMQKNWERTFYGGIDLTNTPYKVGLSSNLAGDTLVHELVHGRLEYLRNNPEYKSRLLGSEALHEEIARWAAEEVMSGNYPIDSGETNYFLTNVEKLMKDKIRKILEEK